MARRCLACSSFLCESDDDYCSSCRAVEAKWQEMEQARVQVGEEDDTYDDDPEALA